MKSKIFLLPIGATVIAAGAACTAISCSPEIQKFEIDFESVDTVTISNKEAIVGKEFNAIVDIGDAEFREIDIILNWKSPTKQVVLKQGKDFTFNPVNGKQYKLTIFASSVSTTDIHVSVAINKSIIVKSACDDPADEISLSNRIAEQNKNYITNITITSSEYRYLNPETEGGPIRIYVNEQEVPDDAGENWVWEPPTDPTQPTSTLTIREKVLTDQVTSIKIVGILDDVPNQLKLTYSGEEGEFPVGEQGFAGEQEGNWIALFRGKALQPSQLNWWKTSPEKVEGIEINSDSLQSGKLAWDAKHSDAKTYQFEIKCGYTLPGTQREVVATTSTINLTINETKTTFEIIEGEEKLDGKEGEGRSNVVKTQFQINGKDPSFYKLTPTYKLTATGTTTQGEVNKFFSFDKTSHYLSWNEKIVASGEKGYTFNIDVECENPDVTTYKASIGIKVVVIGPNINVTSGSTILSGKEGQGGKAAQPWKILFNDQPVTDKITWEIVDCTPKKPEGLDIQTDGLVVWDGTISDGTYKFFAQGKFKSSITDKEYTRKSDQITLTLEALPFVITGSNKLEGKEGIDGKTVYKATLDGKDVTKEATWTIVETTGKEAKFIRIANGEVSWDGVVKYDDQNKYKFKVSAELKRDWKTYKKDIADITFSLEKASFVCQGGTTDITKIVEGEVFNDTKPWKCKFNNQEVVASSYSITQATPGAANFVKISSDGKLYWPVETAYISDKSQDVYVTAKYIHPKLGEFTCDSAKIHIDIQQGTSKVTYGGLEDITPISTIEGEGGTTQEAFACIYKNKAIEAANVSWEVVDVQPEAFKGKITIENNKESPNFGKVTWSSNMDARVAKSISFKVQAKFSHGTIIKDRIVKSKEVVLNIVPLEFHLDVVGKITDVQNGHEGYAGNVKNLTFNTKLGDKDHLKDVTKDTTFEFLDGGETADFLSSFSFNKETGVISWDDTLKKGTYKIKLKASITKSGLQSHPFEQTSEVITIEIKENVFEIKHDSGALKAECREFQAFDWPKTFQPGWKGDDAEPVKFQSQISFGEGAPTGIAAKFSGDGNSVVTPSIGNKVSRGTYKFDMTASYTLTKIEKTYTDKVSLELTVTSSEIVINGGTTTISAQEWCPGTQGPAYQVMYEKTSGSLEDITNECTFEYVEKAEQGKPHLSASQVWVDSASHQVAWNNNIEAGEYNFAFKVTWNYSGQTFTAETKTIKFTVGEASFSVIDGVTEITPTEWTSGTSEKNFNGQLSYSDGHKETVTGCTWAIETDSAHEKLKDYVSIDSNGKLSWNENVSADINLWTFNVVATYERKPSPTSNTKYTARSSPITIKVNNAVFEVTGGFKEATIASGPSDIIVISDKEFKYTLNPAGESIQETCQFKAIDCTGLPQEAHLFFNDNLLCVSNLPPTAQQYQFKLKVQGELDKVGRSLAYTDTTDEITVTVLPSPEAVFQNMEWSEVISTVHGQGGLDALKEKIGLDKSKSMVGFTKPINVKFSDTEQVTHSVRIIAENHDDVSDTEKAALTFEFVNVITHKNNAPDLQYMDYEIDPTVGITWPATKFYNFLSQTFITYLPAEIQSGMLAVSKSYLGPNEILNGGYGISKQMQKIWIASCIEMGMTDRSAEEGYRYEYYDGEDMYKKRIRTTVGGTNPIEYWTRSVYIPNTEDDPEDINWNYFNIEGWRRNVSLKGLMAETSKFAYIPCFCI